jgi:hypothetical protein
MNIMKLDILIGIKSSHIFAASDVEEFLVSKNVSNDFPERGFELTMLVDCRYTPPLLPCTDI